jgi:hypothetical protein
MPVAVPSAERGGDEDWTTPWLGVLLMIPGIATVLSASRTIRQALWTSSDVRY